MDLWLCSKRGYASKRPSEYHGVAWRQAQSGEGANRFGQEPVHALSQPLPFNTGIRNGLSFLLLLTAVVGFWHPLVLLFSLTQQQEHYSHIVLIPCLSLYVLYLHRKAINASREWSPWLGLFVIGLGAWCYWFANAVIFSPDQLSITILALVLMCWGIFSDLLRGHALPRGFVWAALSPFYGAASFFSLGCHRRISSTQLGRSH